MSERVLAEGKQLVLMHQGGWDEALIGLGPLIIIGALIFIARKARPDDDEYDEEYEDGEYDADGGAPKD